MKHIIVAIRDIKTDSFFPPHFVRSTGGFLRQLADDVTQPQKGTLSETMNRHADQFEVYKLGEWEDQDGTFTAEKERLSVVSDLLV